LEPALKVQNLTQISLALAVLFAQLLAVTKQAFKQLSLLEDDHQNLQKVISVSLAILTILTKAKQFLVLAFLIELLFTLKEMMLLLEITSLRLLLRCKSY